MPASQHPATLDADSLLAQCDVQRTRGSGPGGQHRNKVETAIRLIHRATGVAAQASERRSQIDNRKQAVFRLRVNLAVQVRTDVADGLPSDLWQSRCRGGRISVNTEHADYPALLAEALDCISATDFDLRTAAERLGCTASQLIKFIKTEPQALTMVNSERHVNGMKPLK